MYRLLASYGDGEQIFVVPDGEVTLGNSPENELVLCVNGVSRASLVNWYER